jgi:predicted Fe-S protein YdhL (DUF1289 family)
VTPNKIIYTIYQNPELLKAWRELSERQKREVVEECEQAEENEIERILEEVASRQRRLF